MTFRRIAVVNRGESAMRLIHAVRDLNAETGSTIQVVALHTEGERRAMFVREADQIGSVGLFAPQICAARTSGLRRLFHLLANISLCRGHVPTRHKACLKAVGDRDTF